jgi:hypothetical protein
LTSEHTGVSVALAGASLHANGQGSLHVGDATKSCRQPCVHSPSLLQTGNVAFARAQPGLQAIPHDAP